MVVELLNARTGVRKLSDFYKTIASVSFLLAMAGSVVSQEPDLTKTEFVVAARVVDDATGEPIPLFRTIPGTAHRSWRSDDEELAIWQPHLVREMEGGVLSWPRKRGYDKFRLRIEAEGYEPTFTEWTGRKLKQITPEIRMRRANLLRGKVVNAEGDPAAGAAISVSLPNATVRLDGCKFQRGDKTPEKLSDWWRLPRMFKCDENGEFEVPAEPDVSAVVCIVHPDGYFDQLATDFAMHVRDKEEQPIQLKRWARVEGQVKWLDMIGDGERISLTLHKDFKYPGMIAAYPNVVSDAKGRFVFEHVPPESVTTNLVVKLPEGTKLSQMQVRFDYPTFRERLEPGETWEVDFGGRGAVVTGQLDGLDTYEGVTLSIRPPAPETFSWFKMGMPAGGDDLMKGYQALSKSRYAKYYFRDGLPVNSDGSFRIEEVMTGKYQLIVSGNAAGMSQFDVLPQGDGDSPVNLGTIKVRGSKP